jgi:hypothetical protein
MVDIFPAVAVRLGNFIRLLSSDRDGEVVAAARALIRTLQSAGADIHVLAERIAQPAGLTDAEMQKIFDAGYDAGLHAAETKFHGDDDFRDTDGKPIPERMVQYCQQRAVRLRGREREFIDSVAARIVYREPSEKQLKWLTSIYLRLGGGRS